MTVLRDSKAAIRKTVLALRDALPEGERASLSRAVLRQILDLPSYQRSGVVLAYASFGSELETDAFLRRVLEDGKTLVLPKVESSGLVLYEARDLKSDLASGTWGIREPRPDRCPAATPDLVDFALVPGSAFDRDGGRLGYGGGFYDRLISSGLDDAPLVSGAFGVQMVDRVPTGPRDVPVDLVVTEKKRHPRRSPLQNNKPMPGPDKRPRETRPAP